MENTDIIEPWIYTRLATDPVIKAAVGDRISSTLAPAGLATPYITFIMASTRDRTTYDGTRIWVDSLYDIKVVVQGASWGPGKAAAARIDDLFGRVTTGTENGDVECTRERSILYAELAQAIQFRHMGAQFRVRAYSLRAGAPVPAPSPTPTPAPSPAPIVSTGPESFVYTQTIPAATWSFAHPLGRQPSVALWVGGEEVDADVSATATSVHVVFPGPTAGIAVLS